MFNTKEQEIIQFGVDNGKTKQEVQSALVNFRLGRTAQEAIQVEEQPSFLQETGQDLSQIGTEIGQATDIRTQKVQDIMKSKRAGETGFIRSGLQTFGQGAGYAADVIGSVFKGLVKAVLPQRAETAIKGGIEKVAKPIVESETVKAILERYNSLDVNTKRDVDALLGTVSLGADIVGGVATGKAIKAGVKAGAKVGKAAVRTSIGAFKPAVGVSKKAIRGVGDVAEVTARGVKQIPGRIQTNILKNKELLQSVKTLPTKTAKSAVQNGVDIRDIKYLYSIPSSEKQPLRNLFTATKNFVLGKSKTNPIEVVGEPIIKRIDELKVSIGTIGQKLGKVADNLGDVSKIEASDSIFNSLKRVQGLNGLKVKSGILNFKDTVLTTAKTASDRKIIQEIFTDATKAGTGKSKHLLRQELFEVLGGKKKALTAITDTQDKAFQAVRRGLSDLLDSKNASYKALNVEYAKVIQPLSDINRFMRLNKLAGASDDLLNMKAGLIARRLTSNAVSNPEIRFLLKSLDDATAVARKTATNVENLQDFYNVLDKYFELSGKTSFQGQVALGIGKTKGVKDLLSQVASFGSQTEAVRLKAFEDAILEILK